MRRRGYLRTQSSEKLQLQMTPMIDVVFLLLIFFIVTSSFVEYEGKLQTNLPRNVNVQNAAQDLEQPPEVLIEISADGVISVGNQVKTPAQLAALLISLRKLYPDQPVVIRGDPQTFHRYVVDVLDACYKAKITNISFESTL